MNNPLTCTQNTLSHIDYGVPLLFNKSTDYRTSTGKNHDFFPSKPQNFDCRVKTKLKGLDKNIEIKDDQISSYNQDYCDTKPKSNVEINANLLYQQNDKINYINSVTEKTSPPMKAPVISEMKQNYLCNDLPLRQNHLVNEQCKMPETYNELQPQINIQDQSFYKLLDIYLTESKLNYVPYTIEQLEKAKEDLITIYNYNGKWKGLKQELPGKLNGRTHIYDKSIFKKELCNTFVSTAPKRVLHCGMSSEYQTTYQNPSYSEFYPFVKENGVYYPDYAYKTAAPEQDLSAPGMYLSENKHIGSVEAVRTYVDVNGPKKKFIHLPCCKKINE